VNFNVAARQHEDRVIFLHKLVPGGANRSYGIAVAQLAGVPEIVLARARTLLASLESGSGKDGLSPGGCAQLEIFPAAPQPRRESELEATLRALELDRMTPLDALLALHRLKQLDD
jgi:DNA mismatch repair protein MutS